MDYREKWLTRLRELGRFDTETIKRAVFEQNGKMFSVAYYMIPMNDDLAICFRRGKIPSISILTRESGSFKDGSFGFSSIYSSGYHFKDDLDRVPAEIKEKVTNLLEGMSNQLSLSGVRQEEERKIRVSTYQKRSQYQPKKQVPTTPSVKTSCDDLNLLTEIEKYIGGNMSLKKPSNELDVKFLISNFLIERNQNSSLDPDVLFYMLINNGKLEGYQLAGYTYYRVKQKSN